MWRNLAWSLCALSTDWMVRILETGFGKRKESVMARPVSSGPRRVWLPLLRFHPVLFEPALRTPAIRASHEFVTIYITPHTINAQACNHSISTLYGRFFPFMPLPSSHSLIENGKRSDCFILTSIHHYADLHVAPASLSDVIFLYLLNFSSYSCVF